ncbi:MAG: hypothetical protein ACRD44_14970 [Bryobacteraceae bacterium]
METPRIERRIRQVGFLLRAGLLLQLVTMLRIHPLAFVVFLALGCPLIAGGIALYLVSLVSPGDPS